MNVNRWHNMNMKWLLLSLLAVLLVLTVADPSAAQRQRSNKVLKKGYFATFSALYRGDYREARKGFKQSISKATKTTDARWIDSICYFAMAGETAYQVGSNAEALEYFNASLRLVVEYYDWMLKVDFGPVQPDAGGRQPPPWGKSQRAFRLAHYRETYNLERTQLGVTAVEGQRAITRQSSYALLHVDELVRCTALSIRRRLEILGPVSARDDLTSSVLAKLSQRPGPPNHWSSAWIDLQHGLALLAAGKVRQARPLLKRSVVAGGEFDHPLTCVALLELGKLSFREGDYATAATLCAEASYSAYYFENPLVIEEALRYGALVHLLTDQQGAYPLLDRALNWARVKRMHVIEASLAIVAAEHAATTSDPQGLKNLKNLMSHAIRAVGREDIAVSRVGARHNYVEAIVASRQGDERTAQSALREALDFMRNGSLRRFQIALADNAYVRQQVSGRAALELFGQLLSDPPPVLWRHEPLEALALLENRNYDALTHWFDLAVETGENRNNLTEAIEIADRARRWRFYEALPASGRLLGLRWVLGAPTDALSEAALLQRNDLVGRYPKLAKLQKASTTHIQDLQRLPLVPEDPQERNAQQALLDALSRNGRAQEMEMRHVAMRREPIEMAFPRQLDLAKMLEQLRPRQAVLAFLQNGRETHAFLIMKKQQAHWKVSSPRDLQKQLVTLLRALGNTGPSGQLDYEFINGDKWLKPAMRLTKTLMKDSRVRLDQGIDEIIVVPDGVLWYLPFELLQFGPDTAPQSLLSIARVRYAPTVSLAVGSERARRRGGTVAIVPGKILSRDDEELAAESANQLAKMLPRAEVLADRPTSPSSMLAKSIDALVVFDAVEPAEDPMQIAPWQIDGGRPGSQLGDWLTAPLGAPELVVWPGFRTPAEASLKGMGRSQKDGGFRAGDDLFQSICGMMSAGTRSVLISRWRAGGRTSQDLIREYLQELPHRRASDAWQRSVQLVMESPINAALEPRVREDREDREITASHPFFWSGYFVVDNTGSIENDADDEGERDAQGRPKIEFPGRKAKNDADE